MLGKRDQRHYGNLTLDHINSQLNQLAQSKKVRCTFFQSNHEGELIDFIQKNATNASGILINPGALTHYGYSLRDALTDTGLPIVEVHLSDIDNREEFRKINVLKDIVIDQTKGLKNQSYIVGLERLLSYINKIYIK